MAIPRLAQLAITEAAAHVQRHPEYQLNREHYCALLQSFGPLIDLSGQQSYFKTRCVPSSPGFRAYGQLALLTAKHVLPIWEQASNQLCLCQAAFPYDIEMPHHMLALAQAVLDQRIDPHIVAAQLGNELYYDMAGLVLSVTYPAFHAAEAAYDASHIVLGGSSQWGEMTNAACKAASVVDCNEVGVWYASTGPSSHPSAMLYHNRDAERAFWEWWLWEAIPTVWTTNE
jgi:Immunity protein Imm5